MKFKEWLFDVVVCYFIVALAGLILIFLSGSNYEQLFLFTTIIMVVLVPINIVHQFCNRSRTYELKRIAKPLSLRFLGDINFYRNLLTGDVEDDDPENQPVGFSKKIRNLPLFKKTPSPLRGGRMALGWFDLIQAFKVESSKKGLGANYRFRNVMATKAKNVSFAVFDYSFVYVTGDSHEIIADNTVVSFYCPKLDFPEFRLWPEIKQKKRVLGFFKKEKDDARDIDFEDSPKFSDLYTLYGHNEQKVRDLFQPAVRKIFEECAEGAVVEAEGDHIVFHYSELPVKLEKYTKVLDNCKTMFRELSKTTPRSKQLDTKAYLGPVSESEQIRNQQTEVDGFETPEAIVAHMKAGWAFSSLGFYAPGERPVMLMFHLFERHKCGNGEAQQQVGKLLEKYQLSDDFSKLRTHYIKAADLRDYCRQTLAHVPLEALFADIQSLHNGTETFAIPPVTDLLKVKVKKQTAKVKVVLQDGSKETLSLVQENGYWYLSYIENFQAALMFMGDR